MVLERDEGIYVYRSKGEKEMIEPKVLETLQQELTTLFMKDINQIFDEIHEERGWPVSLFKEEYRNIFFEYDNQGNLSHIKRELIPAFALKQAQVFLSPALLDMYTENGQVNLTELREVHFNRFQSIEVMACLFFGPYDPTKLL